MRRGYWGANIDHRGRRRAPRLTRDLTEEQRKLYAKCHRTRYEHECGRLISDHDLVESAVSRVHLALPGSVP
jgi:hypothetical protein